MNQNYSNIPLGITPPNATFAKPLSSKDWEGRMDMLKRMGVKEDSLMMRGTEWRRGLALKREGMQDSVVQALGIGAKDSAALGAAAKAGGASGLMSSL
jgi:hypothetical protein